MNRLIKSIAFGILGSPAVVKVRLSKIAASNQLMVANFHRVGPDDRSSYRPLPSSLFADVVAFLKQSFTLLTFADLADFRRTDKPPAIISFDDGYLDFAEHAAPILKQQGVKCNHNLIPACIESGLPPLNVLMQDFVGRAPDRLLAELNVPGFGKIASGENRGRLGNRLSAFLKNKPIAEQKSLADLLIPQTQRMDGFKPTAMMSRGDVTSIATDHELGAHSYEHATLTCEDDDYVRKDAKACMRYFSDTLGAPTDIYALPNGECRPSHLDILRAEGFRHVLLVGENYSTTSSTQHLRFTMYGDSRQELRVRAAGFRRG